MKKACSTMMTGPVLSVLLAGVLLMAASCMSTSASGNQDEPAPSQRSGSELWAQNCRRCHNFRSPSELGDAEWDVAMFHMRVRANLTAGEYDSIRQFLKASN